MRAILFALALAAGVLPASAQNTVCTELAEFVERQAERGATVRPLRGASAQAAIAWYNATPPIENAQFDTVVVVENADKSAAFYFGNSGAVCVRLSMTKETWAKARVHFVGVST